ncbi:MAG: hypothetical protein JWN84_2062 [Nocardioides sp.]|nr:hypothetical protein [Nocardioides sp.]
MRDRRRPTRSGVLRAVIEEILTRDDGRIPADIDGIEIYFSNIEDLTNALLLRWHTRLVASLERSLIDDPEDREEAVIEAWRHAAQAYSGVRKAIDGLAVNPPTEVVHHAVATTAQHDWAIMAITAGLASGVGGAGIRIGHRLELEARRRNSAHHGTARRLGARTLLAKLRAKQVG